MISKEEKKKKEKLKDSERHNLLRDAVKEIMQDKLDKSGNYKNVIWEDYTEDQFWDIDSQYIDKNLLIPLIRYSIDTTKETPLSFEKKGLQEVYNELIVREVPGVGFKQGIIKSMSGELKRAWKFKKDKWKDLKIKKGEKVTWPKMAKREIAELLGQDWKKIE